MKTLYLMRHAKSDWSTSHRDDHERPLNARGQKAAKRMADYMVTHGLVPDMVICSTATRARQTLDALLETSANDVPVHYRRALYFTSPDVILDEIRDTDTAVERLLLVGHNPDTQAMAVHLADDPHNADVNAIARKYPTAALAAFEFAADDWKDVGWGGGRLKAFLRPKALEESEV